MSGKRRSVKSRVRSNCLSQHGLRTLLFSLGLIIIACGLYGLSPVHLVNGDDSIFLGSAEAPLSKTSEGFLISYKERSALRWWWHRWAGSESFLKVLQVGGGRERAFLGINLRLLTERSDLADAGLVF